MQSKPDATPADGATSDPQTSDADRDCSTCPAPLDCDDLAETFRINASAAVHLLMTLAPRQLNLQALAYAAYLNQLHGLDLGMDDILTGWKRSIKRSRHIT